MKEIEIAAITALIDFYNSYIKTGISTDTQKRAKELYDSAPAQTLVSEIISNAFGALFPVAYSDVGSGINPPTKEESKEIIEKLKKRKNELEK